METLKFVLLLLGSYLLGSVSFSIIMSRLLGGDVRKKGSGNAGATNMARIYGMGAGLTTFLLDVAKTLVCGYTGAWLFGDVGLSAAGGACLLGHCFPIYYKFKGGKGVSVGCALAFLMGGKIFVAVMTVFFILVFTTKKVSLASVTATSSILIFGPILGISQPKFILAVCGTILIVWLHRSNIKRLLLRTEPDFKPAKKEK